MDQIYRFNEFVLISESKEIDKRLFDALKKLMVEKNFNRWVNCPNFGGIYARASKKSHLNEIFYKMGGEEKRIEGVFYDGKGGFFLEDFPDIKIDARRKEPYRSWFNNIIFDSIKYDIIYSCGKPFFNPFENNIEDLLLIKKLKKIGMEIVSDDLERSKGILVLRFKNTDRDYAIKPTGEIMLRQHGNKIDTIFNLSKKPFEIINDLEDLIEKIIYIYISHLNYISLFYNSFDLPIISERLIWALKSKENIHNPIYKEEYNKIIREHPKMILYLPEPDGVENKEIIKGIKLLGRSGLID